MNEASIIRALEQAVRAGFSVTFRLSETGNVCVDLAPEFVVVGEATERLEPFTVARRDFRDAAGNALQTTAIEIGMDELEKKKALERPEGTS